jgi:hypothetical protein
MEPFKYFMEELNLIEDIEEIYYRIRLIFQREGWSDEDLQKPPYYPQDLMRLYHKFSDERDSIFKTVRDYGFDVDKVSLTDYIHNKLKKIDDITPLKN